MFRTLLLQFHNYALTITSTPNSHWSASSDYPYSYNIDCCCCWLLLYNSAILRSPADSLHSHVILHEWLVFYRAFLNSHRSGFHLGFTTAAPLWGTNQSQRTNGTSFLRAKCMGSSCTCSMLFEGQLYQWMIDWGHGALKTPKSQCGTEWKLQVGLKTENVQILHLHASLGHSGHSKPQTCKRSPFFVQTCAPQGVAMLVHPSPTPRRKGSGLFHTSATFPALFMSRVHCWAQNGSTPGYVFMTFKH